MQLAEAITTLAEIAKDHDGNVPHEIGAVISEFRAKAASNRLTSPRELVDIIAERNVNAAVYGYKYHN